MKRKKKKRKNGIKKLIDKKNLSCTVILNYDFLNLGGKLEG